MKTTILELTVIVKNAGNTAVRNALCVRLAKMPDPKKRGRKPHAGAIRHVISFGVTDEMYEATPKNANGKPDSNWLRSVFTAALPPTPETFEAVRKELEVKA